ncbi:MAG: hypothetical protein ACMVY4_07765 [Minwuia sp.]|uniref:hypothetical protein n=1 Tax=Minwuia sp. TaxID=2493630 RepID=UPI003A870FB7
MHLDDLLDERERLLGQRADILKAMSPAVMASDLDQAAQEDLRGSVEQALDDAFFGLIDPIETDIEEQESALAFRRLRADIVDLAGRR